MTKNDQKWPKIDDQESIFIEYYSMIFNVDASKEPPIDRGELKSSTHLEDRVQTHE